jgi:hypothetical protein
MFPSDNELPRLGARAGAGDPRAVVELQQRLASEMPRIVRHAMRSTTGPSKLTRLVRAAAHRLHPEPAGHAPPDREQLVKRIAHDLCQSVIGRLQAACLDRQPLLETVRT